MSRDILKVLEDGERHLAELTARVIVTAQEVGLPDAPDKLVEPHAIQFLARAHLELIAKVEQLHRAVGDLEKLAELRRALEAQVQAVRARVDQIARVAIEGALHEVARQQGDIATGPIIDEAKTAGMRAATPFIGAYVNTMPLARKKKFPPMGDADKLRIVQTPDQVAALSADELLAIYCGVMGESAEVFVKYETYIVRQWDGMDGCWTDCTGAVEREQALRVWAGHTGGGIHHITHAEIDYYRIFPGDTHMEWDGSAGKEMFR